MERGRFFRRVDRARAWVLVATCLWLGCGAPVPSGSERPNVLVVVLDSCRADKMGCYGFDRPTTPFIDRFASDPDSVVFERHYVQGNWTKPSTASLFTGLFAHQHRVGSQTAPFTAHLPDGVRTVAEEFADAGYFTFGLSPIPHIQARYGFGRGFQVHELTKPGDFELYQDALRVMQEGGRPFFGYVHFIACHRPYRLRDASYLSRFGFGYDEAERIAEGIDFSEPRLRDDLKEGRLDLTPEDVRFLRLLYESVLRGVDQLLVRPFLEELQSDSIYDETLIVLTADHGEELYEHRGLRHGHALWDEVIRVPLVVKFPKNSRPIGLGSRWEGVTQAIDLYPSLMAAVGLEAPSSLPGRDIFLEPEAQGLALSGTFATELALIRGHEKVVGAEGFTENMRVFDLKADPLETTDLSSERPNSIVRAQATLRELLEAYPLAPAEKSGPDLEAGSPEELRTLRALGYLD